MINFDTIHLQPSDLQKLEDVSEMEGQRHLMHAKDSIVYEEKMKGYVMRFDTNHKLHNPNFKHGVELSVASFFLPHNFPPNDSDIIEMLKAHHYHTDAILSEKSKDEQIEGYTDIFLLPSNLNVQERLISAKNNIIKIVEKEKNRN